MEHLVYSHDGYGYYISNDEPESITKWCETCGDRDDIILSYDEENVKEPFRSIFNYFIRNLIFSRRKLKEQLELFDEDIIGTDKAINEIVYILECEIQNNKCILDDLYENNYLEKDVYNKLNMYIDQMMLKEYLYFEKLGYKIDSGTYQRVKKERSML